MDFHLLDMLPFWGKGRRQIFMRETGFNGKIISTDALKIDVGLPSARWKAKNRYSTCTSMVRGREYQRFLAKVDLKITTDLICQRISAILWTITLACCHIHKNVWQWSCVCAYTYMCDQNIQPISIKILSSVLFLFSAFFKDSIFIYSCTMK